jgi:filamentous hemagglutinin family protein
VKKLLNRLIYRAPALITLLLTAQLCQSEAFANPTGPTVSNGTVSFTSQGTHFTINASDHAFINWQSFNIGTGETTTFVQPSPTSVVWNQINDPNPSQILGNLNANGYVVLQNSSGFYIGGQASITAHGVMLTTAPIAAPDLSSGGAWAFDAPPPTAKIVNYGQINIAGGGPAFLIANDIINGGAISAPGGKIGLYAGQQVLVSTSPDGRGLSAEVTLPQGSVDNQGHLIADGGTIALQAKVVNQGGLIQANSVRDVNGIIELVASDSLNLDASSVVSAHGDSVGTSSGGAITVKSGNNFSDQAGSTINIAGGAQGGNGGQVEISAPQMSSIQSAITAQAATGFLDGMLTIDPLNILLTTSGSSAPGSGTVASGDPPTDGTLTLNVNSFTGLSQINLQAINNITFSTLWTLTDPGVASLLSLSAGNNIIFNNSSGIVAGNNWSVNLAAGTALAPGFQPVTGNDGIYLNGNSYVQTQNGDIKLSAANEVIVNSGAIRTLNGGNIAVTTQSGDVNTGVNFNGYAFAPHNSIVNNGPPYYTVSSALGGISTAAGGNVNINAGGNVTSYLPLAGNANALFDGGTGAFGSQPGDVTVTAGGNVYGHYMVANGTGKVTAGGNVGVPLTDTHQGNGFALSLVKGSWEVDAPNGSIYLQEVRNPNGIFNNHGAVNSYSGYHFFDYDQSDSVLLNADNAVEITGFSVPRVAGAAVPILFPGSLQVVSGAGGFTLDQNVTLFPSAQGDLNIATTGNFSSPAGNYLAMSDSGSQQWNPIPADGNTGSFSIKDHAASPLEINSQTPVNIFVGGDMNNVTVYATKAAQITVGGDMLNANFVGENLQTSGVMGDTVIHVAGKIYYTPSLNSIALASPIVSANPTQPTTWDSVFYLAVDPGKVASLTSFDARNPSIVGANGLAAYLKAQNYLLFPSGSYNAYGQNPGFYYDPSGKQLYFNGNMSTLLTPGQISALEGGTFTVLVADKLGNPVIDPVTGHLQTTTYTFIAPTVAAAEIGGLYQKSLAVSGVARAGLQIGGPGQFNIVADSMDLGNAPGVLSWGFGNGSVAGGVNYASLNGLTPSGAAVNLTLNGDLTMLTSTIGSFDGGDVAINSLGGELDLGTQNLFIKSSNQNLAYGIYTSGHSDVSVTAYNDVNIDGSRIASYNGGNVFVESLHGDVNIGSGGSIYVPVPLVGVKSVQSTPIYGSGIVAVSLPANLRTPGGGTLPGNITVQTPEGSILSSQAGILQLALDGNLSGGPTVSLTAGTPASGDNPAVPGNIDLGSSGLIGGTVVLTAQGDIKGYVISRQDSTVNAAQNFSGTLLSAGSADVSAGGSVAGTVIGVGGVTASSGAGISASLLGQNVSANGGAAQSTLGTTATATSASQSAAQQSSTDTKQQIASNENDDDDQKKKKKPGIRHIKRVTVLLPKSS